MASDTSVVFNLLAKDKATAVVKSAAKKIGTAAAGAGAIGGTALAAGMIGNLEGEAVADKVAASLGLTPEQQKTSGEAASKIFAGAYAGSMGEASEAVGAVQSSISGLKNASDDVLADTTTTALNYAKTFDTDVADAVGTVAVLMKSHLAPTTEEAFDLMTAAAQKVPAALRGDLSEAVNEYAKHFNGLGFTGAQTMGVLVAASKNGAIGLDKAGDAMKEFQIRSTDMSTTSKDAYKTLGLSAHDMANDILAGGDSAQKATALIAKKLLGIKDPAKRANTAIALFGTQMEDLGVDNIPDFLASLADSGKGLDGVKGSADAMGQTLNDNGKARVDAMRNSVTAWTQSLTNSGGAMGTVSAGVASFGGTALAGGAQIATLAIALRGASLGAMFMGTASTIGAAGVRVLGLAMSVSLGPLGIAIVILTALAVGLIYAYKHSEKFRAVVHAAMHGAGVAFKWLMGKAQQVFGWLRSNWPIIRTILTGPIGAAVLYIRRNFDKITGFVSGMRSKIGGAARGMWDGITSAFRGAINAIIGGWNRLSFGIPRISAGPIHYGGFSMHPPQIPYLAKGGVTTGPTLAMIGEAGREAVIPLDRAGEFGFGGGGVTRLEIERGAAGSFEAFLAEMIRRYVRVKGRGSVQTAFGRG